MNHVFSFVLLFSIVMFGAGIAVTNADGGGAATGGSSGKGLKQNFYKFTRCPQAEELVRTFTINKMISDSTLAPKFLRLHYHDCFVRGCDASILLDTVGTNQSEKDARPNLTLGGFQEIEDIKAQVEKVCPGNVSCADILALAARDSVSFAFGRNMWEVPTGRRDSRVSNISDVNRNLPSPFSNFSTLQQLFTRKNLDIIDLVALSGAHTFGESHCGAFSRRLYNFTGKGDMDPSLNATYAETLKQQCPPNPADNSATTVVMDPDPMSSHSFDSQYFAVVNQNMGLFQSDAALLTNSDSAAIVNRLQSATDFFFEFGRSMVKMGSMEVLTGTAGEIRQRCSVVNP